jgi:serine/threonine-protein kinase RsbW
MADPAPNVCLSLLGTAENVVLVRGMLAGLGQITGIDGSDLNDISTAVTEACNNVVMHAYDGEHGPLELEVCIAEETIEVLVRDRGGGIRREDGAGDETATGIGLHVIQTLARTVEVANTPKGGTSVRMVFAVKGARASVFGPRDGSVIAACAPTGAPTTIAVSIAPVELARGVLPRIVSALAARAHFSTDRISDAQLLADALVAHAGGSTSGDRLSVDVSIEPRELELRIAPLRIGRAHRLIGAPETEGFGGVIDKLVDRHDVAVDGAYETLTVGLLDRR